VSVEMRGFFYFALRELQRVRACLSGRRTSQVGSLCQLPHPCR
jgi:hypothetical protein